MAPSACQISKPNRVGASNQQPAKHLRNTTSTTFTSHPSSHYPRLSSAVGLAKYHCHMRWACSVNAAVVACLAGCLLLGSGIPLSEINIIVLSLCPLSFGHIWRPQQSVECLAMAVKWWLPGIQ
ncbi:hypothetical protein ACLKA7_016011 [Drosophila subpalustris]